MNILSGYYRLPGLLPVFTGLFCSIVFLSTLDSYAEEIMALKPKSTAFREGGKIPTRYTCEGNDISPPLTWKGVPDNTRSLVLIIDDPDAPDPRAPKMTWVHWVLYNIPPDTTGLAEGTADLPTGTGEGVNDWRRTGYGTSWDVRT